tara:strand:- start:914 stop:2083 length:1170 start_codon:yes stop_codon:yes gene_type:complete
MSHRPLGIGVQGLADAFAKMDISFDSDEAEKVNKYIFETMYYASISKSNELSAERHERLKLLQNEFIFDLFTKQYSGYVKWFIKIYNNNYYDSNLIYYNNDDECLGKNITDKYHDLKPSMKEIFGLNFYEIFKEYLNNLLLEEGINKNTYNLDDKYKNYLNNNKHCGAYSSFEGSPISEGKFQFDLWGVKPSDRYDWEKLRINIKTYGVRNSLCIAPMPTASTSQILSNNECFEPFTSNIYSRRTLAGEFVVINKYLMKELKNKKLWSVELKNKIIEQRGSIQKIENIPEDIKNKYKIVWDMSMKRLIDMAKDRGAFICQSQSMNLWVEDPNYKNLTSMHFYAWKAGLKTGIYYLRRKAKHQAQQFTIEPTKNNNLDDNNEEICEMCSS